MIVYRLTHYARNLMSQVPKSAAPWVATLVRTLFEQPDQASVRAQMASVIAALDERFPKAAEHLEAAHGDLPAFTAYPREVWRQIWSNDPQERLNKEIRRRTDVVGIFPDHDAILRLVGAVLAEQSDEWTEQRRYRDWRSWPPAAPSPHPATRSRETRARSQSRHPRRINHRPRINRWPYTTPTDATGLTTPRLLGGLDSCPRFQGQTLKASSSM